MHFVRESLTGGVFTPAGGGGGPEGDWQGKVRHPSVIGDAMPPPLQGAAESSAAFGGYSETEQVQRSQSTSVLQRAPCDAGTANRTVDAPQAQTEGCRS